MGVQITIDYSWIWIFLIITGTFTFGLLPVIAPERSFLVYLATGIFSSFIFFASVLFHELSHTLIARKNKVPISKITLFFFGGASNLEDEPPTAISELKMAVAGPLASIFLGIVFLAINFVFAGYGIYNIVLAAIGSLGIINIFLAVFNLLPGFPLDGGRILRALFWLANKDMMKSTKIAVAAGKVIASLIIVLGVAEIILYSRISGFWYVLIGWFLFRSANASLEQAIVLPKLRQIKVSEIMDRNSFLDSNMNLYELFELMRNVKRRFFLVRNNKSIAGLLLAGELNFSETNLNRKIYEYLKPLDKYQIVKSSDTALSALNKMGREEVALVNDGNGINGLISSDDFINFFNQNR